MTQSNEELKKRIQELEQQVKDKEMAFQAILENTMAGYWDWNIPENIEYLSPTFKAMFGYEDHEMENVPESWQKIIHPDDLPGVFQKFEEHIASKGEIPFDNEVRYFHKNGSIIWVWCKGAVVEWAEDGSPIRMLGSHVEITKLKTLNSLFEEIQNVAHMGVWRVDVQAQKAYWSDEVYHIHEVEPGTEISVNDGIHYYHDDYKDLISQVVQDGIENNRSWDVEAKLVTAKGNEKWVRAIGIPIQENGEIKELRGLFADIDLVSKRKIELEEAIEQIKSEKERAEQFAYITSHDLQEPLRTIMSMLELLEDDLSVHLTGDLVKKFDFIKEASVRMKSLINDLLDFSRIGANAQISKVDLHQITHEIKSDLTDLIARNDAELEIVSLPVIFGYKEDLKMLIRNMITNAIKFRSPDRKPNVKVFSETNEGKVILQFQDNGIGIDLKYSDKVFKIFQRLHSREEYEGTGIGLAHCMKIAELHNGKITFDSQLGEGTTFHVILRDLTSI